MSLADLLFYLFATGILAGAGVVAFSRSILRSALGLLAALAGMSVMYAFLAADFLAVAQLLVYVGGVVVLILFAIMLTSRIGQQGTSRSAGIWGGGALLAVLVPLLVAVAVAAPWAQRTPTEASPTTLVLGNALLTQYLFPFELASLVLLATLVGAVVIARKEIKRDEDDEPGLESAKGAAR